MDEDEKMDYSSADTKEEPQEEPEDPNEDWETDSAEESDDEQSEAEEGEDAAPRVYLPGLAENDEKAGNLECDMAAYTMYHTCGTLLPCLSFDVIPDNLGENRTGFPVTCYCVAGSQAEKVNRNSLLIMKMSNLMKVKEEKGSDEEDSDEDSEEDEDELPELECAQIRHNGAVNRVKFSRLNDIPVAASFSETSTVHFWDLTEALRAVDDSRVMNNFKQNSSNYLPIFSSDCHKTEGFALSWSRAAVGCLASGDCDGNINIFKPTQDGKWQFSQKPFISHTASVEDIQWSPNEANVFASCSSDRSIKIWDIRHKPDKACMLTTTEAHSADVNVIHWNYTEPFIVSGSDAGDIKIWDLRRFANASPAVATFKHHRGPVCSVEWHPTDSTVFAAAGEDNQLTQWDIAVEKSEDDPAELISVPPQLLFIHQGQTEIKELHWHPQIPGVILSSAINGIDVFKTISV